MAEYVIPQCLLCGTRLPVMKRCTQCHKGFYCSRDCQKNDWGRHRTTCSRIPTTKKCSSVKIACEENIIFNTNSPIDDSKGAHISSTENFNSDSCYLYNNVYHYDVPDLNNDEDICEIKVKSNKLKTTQRVQKNWTGREIFKYLSCRLQIPLEKMRVIHRGRLLTVETIACCLSQGALFQVLGAKAADERGLVTSDVDIMMSQLKLDRNDAVLALHKNVDLIDAILDAANK